MPGACGVRSHTHAAPLGDCRSGTLQHACRKERHEKLCGPRSRRAAEFEMNVISVLIMARLTLYEWDWIRAEREYLRAIEVDPHYAGAYHWCAQLLAVLGRQDEALHEIETARRCDLVSVRGWTRSKSSIVMSQFRCAYTSQAAICECRTYSGSAGHVCSLSRRGRVVQASHEGASGSGLLLKMSRSGDRRGPSTLRRLSWLTLRITSGELSVYVSAPSGACGVRRVHRLRRLFF